MLPLQQAFEVRSAIEEYLKATFTFNDKAVHDAFYRFLNHPDEGLTKGPYISLKLPFVTALPNEKVPLDIRPDFPPYRHQQLSFHRLTTQNGHQPQPTIITTGTSSGKTECFLYPLLDYCFRQQKQQGIKAIILYPMNALATDQAKRLAEAIWNDDRLNGKITAGLFIGEGGPGKKNLKSDMGPTHIIETRDSILASPPDILLTNFKMLDYALMKGHFSKLWNFNYADPFLLRFLVLDELHTYDGAQGTDVANLIRRLKLKLNIPENHLCPIGTSATIGSGPHAAVELVNYASKVFGEVIEPDAVITENRMKLEDFMPEPENGFINSWPHPQAVHRSGIGENENYDAFLQKQKILWQLDPRLSNTELAHELKQLQIVHDLLEITSKGTIHLQELIRKLANANEAFNRMPEWDQLHKYNPREQIIQSILSLLSKAKVLSGNRKSPFLFLQVQLWVRELSSVLRKVAPTPAFTWKNQVDPHDKQAALPPYFCRECGASGWLAVKLENKPNELENNLPSIYTHFFNNDKNLYFLNTPDHDKIDEYKPTDSLAPNYFLHSESLVLQKSGGEKLIPIIGYRLLQQQNNSKARHVCPECNTEDTIAIIGTRVATLSSITISQVLSSNLDNRSNQERKILAFTNSVQDAAHQAGFIEARNYRFTFRSSLQQVINSLAGPVTLPELEAAFISYWKKNADETGKENIEAYVYRFFPDDYKGKVDLSFDYRDYNKQFKNFFLKELDLRISWEIFSEFSYSAQIGRTLEKTGTSATRFNTARILDTFEKIFPWMQQNLLGMIGTEAFLPFMNGLMHRMRIRGAVDHPFLHKFRTENQDSFYLNWIRDDRHFLNKLFGPKSRYPKLLVTVPISGEPVDTTYTQSTNWYHAYFRKSFTLAPTNNKDLINDFYQELLRQMLAAGLVNACKTGNTTNFALTPENIIIENTVRLNQCSNCNHTLQTAETASWLMNTPCLDYRCPGTYNQQIENQLNYYQRVYNRDLAPRIYASEHTGLLPRELREDVENQFKERPNFDSYNALVATSTLEMGINIGTLNATINNSVPPAPSNFLQRIGRAGRASGTALITNFATSKNHDLFHFTEPLGMMEGEVGTPGCFLEAREILSRHFMAFCLDDWSKADPRNNNFPNRLSMLGLLTTDVFSPNFIINKFLQYVEDQWQVLINRFKAMYKRDNLPSAVYQPLELKLRTKEWSQEIRQVFQALKDELLYLKQQADDIEKTIKDRQLAENDPEYIELKAEKRALNGISKIIRKRSTYEHLTNRGFLPNYAFPETGVKLQAAIRAFSAKASEAPPVHKEFEIVRDAATALRELAPSNDFYGLGYKFHISGINTYNWNDPAVLEWKRFCSNCDRIDDDVMAKGNFCPSCGDSSWAADSNKHYFIKLQSVKSSNKRHEATINDSAEERKPVIYRQTRHLRFHPNTSFGAKGMRDIPFGIEYVKQVDSTEVNLGKADVMSSNRVNINGMEDTPRHGFITCRYCGKSTTNPHLIDKKEDWHYPYCKHKGTPYTGGSDEVFTEAFLYRSVSTEAIKILLPVQEIDSYQLQEMFKAGLMAGLRLFYKGNPNHIKMWDYQEFNKTTQRFDKYLVLYDSIPGGTGYLEKLFDTQRFSELLLLSYLHIKECNCQHNGKDGCYRCIFTYNNQFVQDELSRSKAEELLRKLVEKSNDWEDFPGGLGSLSGTGQIEESELEDKFLRCLKQKAEKMQASGWKWEEVRHGFMRYYLTIPVEGDLYTWQITPQSPLGQVQGVAYATRPDFLFTIVKIVQNGIELNDIGIFDQIPQWAVYLDGYAFHASKNNLRFYTDIDKRLGIAASLRYLSWTLSWEDLELFESNHPQQNPLFKSDKLFPKNSQYTNTINHLKKVNAVWQYNSPIIDCPTSLDRFLWHLGYSILTDENIRPKQVALSLAMMQLQPGIPSLDPDQIPNALFSAVDPNAKAPKLSSGEAYLITEGNVRSAFGSLQAGIKLKGLDVIAGLVLDRGIEEIEKTDWEQFWQLFNLVQQYIILHNEPVHPPSPPGIKDYSSILQYYDPHLHNIVMALLDAGIKVNPDGDFNLEEPGYPPASAALGVKEKKIFFEAFSEEDKAVFLQAGYNEITVNNFSINQIL